jgi:hypothetical protein
MGLLSNALFEGAGAGLQTMGAYMGKEVDRQQEEDIYAKRARMLADLQRETATNIRNDAFEFANNPVNVDKAIQTETKKTEAAGRLARSEKAKELTDPDLIAAETAKKDREAEADRRVTKAKGSDKGYLSALRALHNATSDVDYRGRELDNAIKQMTVDNAKRIDVLRKEFGTASPERQKAISDEMSLLTGKDTDKFLPVPLKDEMGNVTGYKVFDTKRGVWSDEGGKDAAGDPIKAAMDAARQAKGQKQGEALTSSQGLQTRKDPLSGLELTEREWDKKYGRGDFKKLYAPGEPMLKAW